MEKYEHRTSSAREQVQLTSHGPGYQILVTDKDAQIISNTIAVALTLALPRIIIFIKLILPKATPPEPQATQRRREVGTESRQDDVDLSDLSESRQTLVTPDETMEGDLDETHDNPLPQSAPRPPPRARHITRFSNRIASGLTTSFQEAHSLGDAVVRLGRDHLAMTKLEVGQTRPGFLTKWVIALKNLHDDAWGFALVSAIMVGLFALFIGQQVLAISAAGIVSDSTALSSSPDCGYWVPKDPLDSASGLNIAAFNRAKTSRAVSYAETCYGEHATAEACNIFYRRAIEYSEEHNASCPFSSDVCLYGDSSAYALDTGFMDSSVLGINAPRRYQLRRKTVCSPLPTNSSYIRYRRDQGSIRVAYYYGRNETSTLTLEHVAESSIAGSSLPGYWLQ